MSSDPATPPENTPPPRETATLPVAVSRWERIHAYRLLWWLALAVFVIDQLTKAWISATLNAIRGGQPSTTQPMAGPWLSPNEVTQNSLPMVLPDMMSLS